jgi:ribosomal protein L40E
MARKRCAPAPMAPKRSHHRSVDFAEYILGIDWAAAVVVAGVGVLVGLILLRFLMASTSEVGHMIPGAGKAAGRALLDARDLPENSWVCIRCRSVNTPQASHCYRGCGSRDEFAEPLPTNRSVLAEGQNGRRTR